MQVKFRLVKKEGTNFQDFLNEVLAKNFRITGDENGCDLSIQVDSIPTKELIKILNKYFDAEEVKFSRNNLSRMDLVKYSFNISEENFLSVYPELLTLDKDSLTKYQFAKKYLDILDFPKDSEDPKLMIKLFVALYGKKIKDGTCYNTLEKGITLDSDVRKLADKIYDQKGEEFIRKWINADIVDTESKVKINLIKFIAEDYFSLASEWISETKPKFKEKGIVVRNLRYVIISTYEKMTASEKK